MMPNGVLQLKHRGMFERHTGYRMPELFAWRNLWPFSPALKFYPVNFLFHVNVRAYDNLCQSYVSIFGSTGELAQSFGSHGLGQGQFEGIQGVAVDDNGNIIVADGFNHCVQKFMLDRSKLERIEKASG